ncbi:DUF3192 domain-containing protein [Paraglaciecola aquimarina]|uniref:DUF3192 domain-containing protein n=1 Tax=Paraglaciecola algarum TaxID=3050085 RepID=A0ABS9D8T7_9ALTE|nr:DUF3192 domain-containing protein [Paraglaciecola sp. G1-23]MCF2948413.1 DUF3192 domain-containing protein [Paraglaciecola sp. G1-23]
MRKIIIATLISVSLGLSGCVISVGGDSEHGYKSGWKDKENHNRKLIAKLTPELSYDEVMGRFGLADFNEFYKIDTDTYQVLYYRTQRIEGDGLTTKDECTPLVFKNGILHGWGDKAFRLINH